VIEGPYGRFSYRRGRRRQLWIAGGIGVTPFLSWIRDSSIEGEGFDVDFVLCVRTPIEAPNWREIRLAARRRDWLRVSLHVSSTQGRFKARVLVSDLVEAVGWVSIYLCGPPGMTDSLSREFRRLGVPASQIQSEEFGFR
jgi:predicted ferric reductase